MRVRSGREDEGERGGREGEGEGERGGREAGGR